MFVKIENTGCCENEGKIQIRFAMFLDVIDYGYDKTRAEVFERELTEEELKDETLANLVPKIWQTNPFHNHFSYVDPSLTDDEILDLGEALLKEAYRKWQNDSKIDLKNEPLIPIEETDIELIACENRLIELQAISLERRV
jgi:hypothetical protein